MLLYHGTPAYFSKPSLLKCKPYRDFGCGFYLAEDYFDAVPMAIKDSLVGYVYTYEFDEGGSLQTLAFDGRTDDWLAFIVRSRLGKASDYDLVIGNMAGGGSNLKDKFSKLRIANAAPHEAMDTMRDELMNARLGTQYAFLTDRALNQIQLVNIELIEREAAV